MLSDQPREVSESIHLAALRKDYTQKGLVEEEAMSNPFSQFNLWFEEAREANLIEPNAMVLSTVNPQGRPRGRVVLLKGFSPDGFIFFTNYDSTKGQHLASNPFASLTFHWQELERQVCIEGEVHRISRELSAKYFESRPRSSQIGAWVSEQSRLISGRAVLESRQQEFEADYANRPIPLPPHWGGLRLAPERIEFWQGRPSRLHDRLRYSLLEDNEWKRERLAP